MATPEQFIKAQNGAVELALRDLRRYWATLDLSDGVAVRKALEGYWPALLGKYGEITATLAADRFEELVDLPATMVRAVDPERANGRMRWGIAPLFGAADVTAALARLELITDELVKQPGRSTTIRSAAENRVRFARVPTGAETCTFCLMLASRGAVYSSATSAGTVTGVKLGGRDYKKLAILGDTQENRDAISGGRASRSGMKASIGSKFHGACDCRVEPVKSDNDLERLAADGYSPDKVFTRWQDQLAAEKAAAAATP